MKPNTLTKTSIVCLLAMVCCILWGSAFPCVKIGYKMLNIQADDSASQILFAGMRFTLAGIIAIIIGSVINKKPLIPSKSSWKRIMVLSSFQTILQYFFYYIGLANTTGVKASVIVGTNVFTAILISAFIFKFEKMTAAKAIGCIVGFSGIIVMNLTDFNGNLNFNFKGDGMIFLSTLASAMSSVTLKKFSQQDNTVMLSGYQFLVGGIIMSIGGLAFGGKVTGFTAGSVAMLVYLAMVSAVAYSIWSILVKYNPISRVAVFGFMNPVFGVMLSALLLSEGKESFGLMGIIALALVCTGIFTVNKSQTS